MNSSEIPSRITKAFGVNGLRNNIPTDSSATTDNNGVATFDKGFPPVTMQPLSAGGIPPSGKDVNGALYAVTQQQQWFNSGMGYPFNGDFSSSIGGYPKGSVLPNSAGTGQWLNLIEGNLTNPESNGSGTTGWVPLTGYGSTLIQISSSSIVLSSFQASKERVVISGSLTSNVSIIFPSWIKSWQIENNCTGNFTVICKTSSSAGVIIPNGYVSYIYCDGASISKSLGTASSRDVGVASGQIPDMSYFESSLQWSKSPNGKITQTGIVSSTTSGNTVFTFPIPFPNACRSIICQQQDTDRVNIVGCTPISKSQFKLSAWQFLGGAFSFAATSVTYIAQGD